MGEAARQLPTFEELYQQIRDLPEGVTGEFLVPGVLKTMSRPGRAHRRVAQNLSKNLSELNGNVGGTGWWIEEEAEIRFPLDRLAVPDLCGFRVERVAEVPEENPLEILPDWCCEILSPSTARSDRRLKLPLYASSGVPWIWLVDPQQRLIEVYESVKGLPVLTVTAAEEERAALPPFEREFDLAPWWYPEASAKKG